MPPISSRADCDRAMSRTSRSSSPSQLKFEPRRRAAPQPRPSRSRWPLLTLEPDRAEPPVARRLGRAVPADADHRAAHVAADQLRHAPPAVLPASPTWMVPPPGTSPRRRRPTATCNPGSWPAAPPMPPSAAGHSGASLFAHPEPAVDDPVGCPGVATCRALRPRPQTRAGTAAHPGARGVCRRVGESPPRTRPRSTSQPLSCRTAGTRAARPQPPRPSLLGPARRTRMRRPGIRPCFQCSLPLSVDGPVLPPLRHACSSPDRLTIAARRRRSVGSQNQIAEPLRSVARGCAAATPRPLRRAAPGRRSSATRARRTRTRSRRAPRTRSRAAAPIRLKSAVSRPMPRPGNDRREATPHATTARSPARSRRAAARRPSSRRRSARS